MATFALATLPFVTLFAAMGSLKLTDAVRTYARRSLVDEAATGNVEDLLRMDASVSWPRLKLAFDYEPRLTFARVVGPGPSSTLWLHNAGASMLLDQPRYQLLITQSGTLGEQDFSQIGIIPARPLSDSTSAQAAASQASTPQTSPTPSTTTVAGPTVLSLLPNVRAVSVANEETAANLSYRWARRWRSELRASFGFAGGSNAAAQLVYPRARMAQLNSALGFDWSRRDRISTVLMGARIDTSNHYENWLASVSETWATRWTRSTSSQLGLGVAFQNTSAPNGIEASHWGPIGSASVTEAMLWRAVQIRLQAGLGYSPGVNTLVGRLQNRVGASSLASVTAGRSTVDLTLGASQTVPMNAPEAATFVSAALSFGYSLVAWLGAQTGGQVMRQQLGNVTASARTTWLLYVGMIARAPEARF